MDYWEKAQVIASIVSATISVIGFWAIWKQIRQANKNLCQSNHTAIYSINTEIYKFFAEQSDLRSYFHSNKALTRFDPNHDRVFSLSELLADFFEFILVEKDLLSRDIREPWSIYRKKVYKKSAAFREFMKINADQYSVRLMNEFKDIDPSELELPVSVRLVISEKEFARVDSIYQSCFKEASVPTETQKSWWKTFPRGMKSLNHGSEIIGGVSCWPITEGTHNKLKDGLLKECDICAEDIELNNPKFFYFSEIAVLDSHRKKNYSYDLIIAMLDLLKTYCAHGEVKVLALGFSDEGRRLLEKLGFEETRKKEDTPDHQPLFLLDLKYPYLIDELIRRF